MADYNPPIENLPIFDPLMFKQGDSYITQNEGDKRYLRYPNAQGTENLQAINVNGVATFNTIVKSKEQLQLLDTTASGTTTECLIGANSNNNNRFALIMNPISGAYNGLTLPNDVLLASGDVGGISANQPLTLTTWSVTTNGLRMTDTEVKLGCGGTSQNPTNRITFTPTSSNIYGSLNVYNNLLMNASLATDRQISTGYLNLNPIGSTPGATGTQIYQNAGASYWDNNVNGGSITFATNTSGGVQVLPFQITPTNNQSNVSLLINGLGNYLQFPDGTQQTTAAVTTNKTYTIEYAPSGLLNINIPANCAGISIISTGQGGLAGQNIDSASGTTWNAGGSGGGATSCISQGIIPITSGTLTFQPGTTGSPNYLTYNGVGTVICTSYNGYDGLTATVSAGGAGGPAQIQGSGNTNICNWLISTGSAGTTGGTAIAYQNCAGVPQTSGKPNCVLTTGTTNDTVRGCGMRYFSWGSSINKCPNSTAFALGPSVTITYYIK